MATNGDRIEKMMEYGLTEYEARTYLALLQLGVASARDVANMSRVPRTKIYSVLDDLHAKQLAEIIPERPKKYGVVPFDVYLRQFEREYKAKLAKIEEDKKFLMAAFSTTGIGGPDKAGSFQVLKGRKNVLNRKYEMVGRADRLDVKPAIDPWKAAGLDLSRILSQPAIAAGAARRPTVAQDPGPHHLPDRPIIAAPAPALERG